MHPRLGSGFMTSLESDWGAYLYPIFSLFFVSVPRLWTMTVV